MDQEVKKPTYVSILGGRLGERGKKALIVRLVLPQLGQHGFKKAESIVDGVSVEYWHYGYRHLPGAKPVNVHIFSGNGEEVDEMIEKKARSGRPLTCQIELVVKTMPHGAEYIQVNLYTVQATAETTSVFRILPAPTDPADRPWFVYTTKDMGGIGISVEPIWERRRKD